MDEQTLASIGRINQLAWGFVIARAVHVAAKFGLADKVSPEGTTAADIAAALNLNPDRLYRLMRLLASYEIFDEKQPQIFYPTPLSDVLRTDAPVSIRSATHLVTKSMWQAHSVLDHCIKTGGDAYSELYNKGVFDYLADHPEENKEFDEAMHNYAELENPPLASMMPLEGAKSFVDIGGGQGGFIREVLNKFPNLEATLFDQPSVVAQKLIGADDPLAARFNDVGGSFFEEIPAGKDTYALKRILHDWNDEDCIKILKTVHKAMRDDSRLFVLDAIVPDGNVPHFSKDLELFLITWGGNERNRAEFEAIFEAAGFDLINVIDTGLVLSITEARKK